MPVWIDTGGPLHPVPGWDILRYYLAMVTWGPLVVAVACDYRSRRTQAGLTVAAAR
jgi:hypothetical protein